MRSRTLNASLTLFSVSVAATCEWMHLCAQAESDQASVNPAELKRRRHTQQQNQDAFHRLEPVCGSRIASDMQLCCRLRATRQA